MLVVVNQPHINDFRIEGTLSSTFLDNLRKEFGDSMKIVQDDEEWVDVRDLDWYREIPIHPMPYGQAMAMLFLIEALDAGL